MKNSIVSALVLCGFIVGVSDNAVSKTREEQLAEIRQKLAADKQAKENFANRRKLAKQREDQVVKEHEALMLQGKKKIDESGAKLKTLESICGFNFGSVVNEKLDGINMRFQARTTSYTLVKPFRQFRSGRIFVSVGTKRQFRIELETRAMQSGMSSMIEEYNAVRDVLAKHYKADYYEDDFSWEPQRSLVNTLSRGEGTAANMQAEDRGKRESYFRIGDVVITLALEGKYGWLKLSAENIKLAEEAKSEFEAEKKAAGANGEDAL